MNISQVGINFIKKEEGCILKVYLDVVGVKTLGYGHTGPEVNVMPVGTPISKEAADAYLLSDLHKFEMNVEKYNPIYHWQQHEFDALVSFAFNVGSIDQLTAKGTRTKQQIANKMLEYNKAGKKVISGLTKRRTAERNMFLGLDTNCSVNTQQNGYLIGKVYTTNANLYIRLKPYGDKLEMKSLTTNAQINAYTDKEGYSILRKGTRVTCKSIQKVNDSIWIQIPSGWICAKENGKVYVV